VHNLLKRIDLLEEEVSGTRSAKRRGDIASLGEQFHKPASALPSTRAAQLEQPPQPRAPVAWLRDMSRQPQEPVAEFARPQLDPEQTAPEVEDPTLKPAEPPAQGYLGAANTLTFCQTLLDQEEDLEDHQGIRSSSPPRREGHGSQTTAWKPPLPLGSLADSWPQRHLGDHLVDCYVDLCYPQYPFIHGPSFKRRYESMWTSRERQSDAWIATVNAVFALGCQFTPNMSPELGDEFFKKATSLIKFDNLSTGTLESLQALILMSLYLQSSANLNHSWNIIGFAVRQAQSLGLHLQRTLQRPQTPLLREIRKRAWTACYVLDSVSAMMLGRPPMIPPDACAWIEAIALLDDDQIPTGRALQFPSLDLRTNDAKLKDQLSNTSSEEGPREMAFFLATIRQCEFMREVVKVYDRCSDHSLILEIDDRLCQWMANCPSHLRLSNPLGTNKKFWQQRVVLTSR
jgi:hypothetical protein